MRFIRAISCAMTEQSLSWRMLITMFTPNLTNGDLHNPTHPLAMSPEHCEAVLHCSRACNDGTRGWGVRPCCTVQGPVPMGRWDTGLGTEAVLHCSRACTNGTRGWGVRPGCTVQGPALMGHGAGDCAEKWLSLKCRGHTQVHTVRVPFVFIYYASVLPSPYSLETGPKPRLPQRKVAPRPGSS